MRIEYSEFVTFCKCPKSYYYSYIEKLEPILPKQYFTFGSVFHSAVQSYHKGEDWKLHMDTSFDEFKEKKKDYLTTDYLKKLEKDKELLRIMIQRYIDFLFFYNIEYISGEEKHKKKMGDADIEMWGKPDMLIKNDEIEELIELKTTTNIGESYRDFLRMSPQPIWYSIITGIPKVRYVLNRKALTSSKAFVEELLIEPTKKQKSDLIEFVKGVVAIRMQFQEDVLSFYPNVSILCSTCQFNDLCICSANEEEEEIKKALYQQKEELCQKQKH